ncbi:RidA family protein [Ruegeria sp. Ofav3-42]|uniref:RidA family protein n=1 Tax=Ruegeria sp. Ofav3-42 TaxID=2917759 RepID=UPI001EF3FAA4|nr:Rid family hydrolase [Ruegeria sp. Ofav3-42]MCG7522359.1 Rid family hydrolase [Ruegeria sp. Ofav3-42]
MTLIVNTTADAPSGAGPYSQAVRAGDFLFLSGIGSLDVDTHEILGTTAAEQLRITMEHIKAILAAHDATLANVVKMGLYLQDPDDYEEANAAYAEYFTPPFPARLSIGAGQVWEMKVKLDCIAYLGT